MANKKLVLAVAGSGKTRHLIDQLNLSERFLIVTYTNTSLNLIKARIIKKFGYHPTNIKTFTYFEFIYAFCIKPFVFFKYQLKGIYWDTPPDFTTYKRNTDLNKYLTKGKFLYHNRMGKFIEYENLIVDVRARLEKFFDHFYFDEFQDLVGHDFNFITQIVQANINFLFVGDFFQHTYVTSYDGNVNGTLYSNLTEYYKKIEKHSISIDTESLSNSFRCSPTICSFITENLKISIQSHRTDSTDLIYIDDKNEALKILSDSNIIKLVYDKSHERPFLSKNWGECKGEDDYIDTCIILNKTTAKLYKENQLIKLAPRTKNKLYVAFTRTKGNCFLIDEQLIK